MRAIESPAIRMAALAHLVGNAFIFNGPRADVEELRETIDAMDRRSKKLLNDAKALLGRAQSAGRDLTADEARRFDATTDESESLERELRIARAELANAEGDVSSSTPGRRMTSPEPLGDNSGRRPTMPRPVRFGRPSARFSDVFAGREIHDPYGDRFHSFGDFCLAVANAPINGADPRLITNASMGEASGPNGGFLVPVQYLSGILDAALDQEAIRPRANVLPMASKQAAAPVFDFADRTGAKRAGLQLLWTQESAPLTEQQSKAREVLLNAHKATILCRVSSELAADVPMFDAQLGQAMVAAVAAGLDTAFMAGTGAGQPLGIINGPSTITVSKESGQATGTLLLQNLAKMVARLSPASFARSTWFAHPTCIPALYTMSVVIQNVAGTENVGGSQAAAVTVDSDGQIRIFGRPCVITDACAPLSSLGDIVLTDLSKYIIGQRADASIQVSRDAYFASDEIGFKLTLRMDGMPADAQATKLKDGTNTVSPFVILQAR